MTVVRNTTLPHAYRDSVVLMQISKALSTQPGVQKAAVMMGTAANLEVLDESGLFRVSADKVAPDDLLIAVEASTESEATQAIEWAIAQLKEPDMDSQPPATGVVGVERPLPRRWRDVADSARLALISTPGPYAAAEAWKALLAGRHVFLFSDNVAIEDEVALKRAGRERGLLVMGPECGTAIIGGVPLGFANRVRRGSIGLVAASGSGLQEVTCLIDRLGAGVSHAIGTGGRDLSAAVGGLTMQHGIELLLDDKMTDVLVLVSKPPDPEIAASILETVRHISKPVGVCFLGADPAPIERVGCHPAHTLEEAARLAVELSGVEPDDKELTVSLPSERPAWADRKSLLRGLFAGGTLAYEAMVVLQPLLGPVWSNAPLDPSYYIQPGESPDGHVCLDLGAQEYTTGQPHPMIDGTTRAARILREVRDPRVGLILLDVILGLGSDPDPAGSLIPAIEQAQQIAVQSSRSLFFVASVTGTLRDPQSFENQVAKLQAQGVFVAPSNAAAARVAARLLTSARVHG